MVKCFTEKFYFHMESCGIPSSHLSCSNHLSASSVPGKRIQDSVRVEFINGEIWSAWKSNPWYSRWLNHPWFNTARHMLIMIFMIHSTELAEKWNIWKCIERIDVNVWFVAFSVIHWKCTFLVIYLILCLYILKFWEHIFTQDANDRFGPNSELSYKKVIAFHI